MERGEGESLTSYMYGVQWNLSNQDTTGPV